MGKFKSCVWGVGVTRIAFDLKEMFWKKQSLKRIKFEIKYRILINPSFKNQDEV